MIKAVKRWINKRVKSYIDKRIDAQIAVYMKDFVALDKRIQAKFDDYMTCIDDAKSDYVKRYFENKADLHEKRLSGLDAFQSSLCARVSKLEKAIRH